jgi:hypothetical protein
MLSHEYSFGLHGTPFYDLLELSFLRSVGVKLKLSICLVARLWPLSCILI